MTMGWASSEAVSVLSFLLPGFVAAAVFHSLTSYPKAKEFDRVVQALIFTVIAQAIVQGIQGMARLVKSEISWIAEFEILVSVCIAVAVAIVVVYLSNHDTLHGLLRRLGVTKETAYPSEWYSTFYRNSDCYVILHLQGQRRLYGWPEEWPSLPDQGHFRIAEGEWLVEDKRILAEGVVAIVIPAKEVEMVEFIRSESSDST